MENGNSFPGKKKRTEGGEGGLLIDLEGEKKKRSPEERRMAASSVFAVIA